MTIVITSLMLFVLPCAQYAAAQTVKGAISGTVVDAAGKAGATVRLINEQTNDARILTTGESTWVTQYIREYRRLSPFDPGLLLYNTVTSK